MKPHGNYTQVFKGNWHVYNVPRPWCWFCWTSKLYIKLYYK